MEFSRTKYQVRISNRHQDNDIFGIKERNGFNENNISAGTGTGTSTPAPIKKKLSQSGVIGVGKESEFICNNCAIKSKAASKILKASIISRSEASKFEQDAGIYVRGKQDMRNTLDKFNIKAKVEEREARSLLASKSVMKIKVNPEKENFIEKTQKETFFLHKDCQDPLKVKTIQKFNRTQMSISSSGKFMRSEKPELINYYEKCVEKSAPKDFEQYKNSKLPSNSEYKAALNEQLLKKSIENENKNILNKRQERAIIEKTQQEYEREIKESKLKSENMKDAFLATNKSMIILKSKKQDLQNLKSEKEEQIKIRKDQIEAEKATKEVKEKEIKLKKTMNENLQKQVNEKNKINTIKQRKDEIEKSKAKPWLNDGCGCTSDQTCGICKRKFTK